MSTLAPLAFALLASHPGLAADTVERVALGLTPGGEQLRLVVWTASDPVTPEGVHLDLSPFPGAPPVPAEGARLDSAKAEQQLWTVSGLGFREDASGDLLRIKIGLWDEQAALVDALVVEVGAGGLAAGPDSAWQHDGYAHAWLRLDESGRQGTLALVLGGAETPRVRAVSVEVEPEARPTQARHAARLTRVQQLWVATLEVPADAGDRYQVDGVVLDGTGSAFGTAFVSQLRVLPQMPPLSPPAGWPIPVDGRVAAR